MTYLRPYQWVQRHSAAAAGPTDSPISRSNVDSLYDCTQAMVWRYNCMYIFISHNKIDQDIFTHINHTVKHQSTFTLIHTNIYIRMCVCMHVHVYEYTHVYSYVYSNTNRYKYTIIYEENFI
jgi:hypothetical protein